MTFLKISSELLYVFVDKEYNASHLIKSVLTNDPEVGALLLLLIADFT